MKNGDLVRAVHVVIESDYLGTGTDWTHAVPGDSGTVETVDADDGLVYVRFDRTQTFAEVPAPWLRVIAE